MPVAVTETHVAATPERCFEVLSDPRSFAYWVVGSRKIRSADPDWPAAGSKFHHEVAGGIKDHTVVEEVEPSRRLRMRARARPLGTAFVTVTMQPEGHGSRLRLEEEPADRLTRLLFNPVLDRLLRVRNVGSLSRLEELVEGTTPIPSGDLGRESVGGSGSSPDSGRRASGPAAGFGRGCLAGVAGGIAMSASTVAEMRLTGRAPSSVPARAIERLFAIEKLGERGERRMTLAAHFVVSAATGGAWGSLAAAGVRGPARAPLLFGIAAAPDVAAVPAMGLAPAPWRWSPGDVARTAVHHGVFAAVAYWAFSRLED